MSDIYTWKEYNKDHLYNLYKIILKNIDNFKDKVEYLNKNNSYNLKDELNNEFFYSEEFIIRFIKLMYLSSSKKISSFDRLI